MLEVIADLLDDVCDYLSKSRIGIYSRLFFPSMRSSANIAAFFGGYKDKMADHKEELARAKEAFDRSAAIDNYEMVVNIGECFDNGSLLHTILT